MSKIITDLNLKEVLSYSKQYDKKENKDPTHFIELVTEFDSGGLRKILVSDLNKGAFDNYKNGHLQWHNGEISFAKLKTINQENWLKEEIFQNWFRIYDAKPKDYFKSWMYFYFNDDPAYGPVVLRINKNSEEFEDRERVKEAVSPFIYDKILGKVIDRLYSRNLSVSER